MIVGGQRFTPSPPPRKYDRARRRVLYRHLGGDLTTSNRASAKNLGGKTAWLLSVEPVRLSGRGQDQSRGVTWLICVAIMTEIGSHFDRLGAPPFGALLDGMSFGALFLQLFPFGLFPLELAPLRGEINALLVRRLLPGALDQ